MKNIKIGIIGAKFAGSFHAEVWKTLPGAEVYAVAEISEKDREAYRAKYDVPKGYGDAAQMIADPDIDLIDVCVPNFLHAEMAIKAMTGGKDVISEKPFATTMADAEKIVETKLKTGKTYFYAEDWIFAPALLRAEEILREGGIGTPFYYKGKECHNGSHSPFAQTIRYCGGGAVIHLGIHAVGYFHHLLGMPEKVVGVCSGGGKDNFIHKGMEGEDWGGGFLLYPDGKKVLVEGNYITTGGMDDVVEIYGSDGRLSVDLTFGSPLSVFSKKGISYAVEKAEFTQGWTRPAVNENESLGYKNELSHFLACLRGEAEQARGTTAEAGFGVFRIIDGIYRSHREERTVKI
jgi:predicted dehydrogenase